MKNKKIWVAGLIFSFSIILFFYKTFFLRLLPFPGDLLLSEYTPWKNASYNGYAPGAIPSKAQYFDTLREFYPWRKLVKEEIENGRIPLWNPYNFSGTPLLANFQSAVFYPFNILSYTLPLPTAWTMEIVLQPLLGGIFTILYATSIGLSPIAAILVALLWNFSSFASVWLEFNSTWHAILWLPLLLYIVETSIQRKEVSLLSIGIMIFSIFSSITAGHPQDFINSFLFFSLYATLRLIFAPLQIKEKKDIAIFLLGGTMCGFLLASIQLLPTIELYAISSRSPHEYAFIIDNLLIKPYQLIMIAVQDFFGNPATRSYYLSDTYANRTLSIGVSGLVLAIVGFIYSKKSWHMVFFIFSAVTVLCLTVQNPISAIFYRLQIPILSTATPTRMLFIFTLSLSVLAGYGIDAMLKKHLDNKVLLSVTACVIFFSFGGLLVTSKIFPTFINPLSFSTSLRALIFSSTFAVLAVMTLALPTKKLAQGMLIVIVFIELFYGFNKFNPFVPESTFFPTHPVFDYLLTKKIERYWGYGTAQIETNFATAYRVFSPDGTDPLNLFWYNQFVQSSRNGKLPIQFNHTNRSDALIVGGYGKLDLMQNTDRLRILDTLGVARILDRTENQSDQDTFPPSRFEQEKQFDGWTVMYNKNKAARFFLTTNIATYSSKEEFERKFFDPKFRPDTTVLLEKNPLQSSKPFTAPSSVSLVLYLPNTVTFESVTDTESILFLSDTYAPGWKAYIDGVPSQILRAQYAFRGVVVPKGNHTIVFSYEPFSFALGKWISLVTLFGVLAILTFIISKKRYSRSTLR